MADNITLSLLMRDSYREGENNRGGNEIKALGFEKQGKGKDEQSGFQAHINKDTNKPYQNAHD